MRNPDEVQELEERFPFVPWREPLPVTTPQAKGFACRICVANYGLNGSEVGTLPQTLDDFWRHMLIRHQIARPEQ